MESRHGDNHRSSPCIFSGCGHDLSPPRCPETQWGHHGYVVSLPDPPPQSWQVGDGGDSCGCWEGTLGSSGWSFRCVEQKPGQGWDSLGVQPGDAWKMGGCHPWAQGRGLVKKAVPGSGRGHVGGEDHLVFPERLKGLLFRFFPYGVVGVTVKNAQEGWNIPPTCQAWSCLRAFAYAVPSAQISTWLAPSQLSTLLAQISPPLRGPP